MEKWIEFFLQAGIRCTDPKEALRLMGALLKSDQDLMQAFIKDAQAAWVGGWTPPRPSSPQEAALALAIREAIQRLARQRGWKKDQNPQLKIEPETEKALLAKIRSGKAPQGAFRLVVNRAEGVSPKALRAAAKRLVAGEEIFLQGVHANDQGFRRLLMGAVAQELAAKQVTETVEVAWKEEVPLLPGDRWEALEALEPRIQGALEGLRFLVTAAELEAEAMAEVQDTRDWIHQGEFNPRWVKGIYRQAVKDPAASDIPAHILASDPEVLRTVRQYADQEGLDAEYGYLRQTRRFPEWYRVAREALRTEVPTFAKVRAANRMRREEGSRRDAANRRFLYWMRPIVVHTVLTKGFRDPESAIQEGLFWVWKELQARRYVLNPFLFLTPGVEKFLSEYRLKEKGRISRRDTRIVRKALALQETEPSKAAALLEENDLSAWTESHQSTEFAQTSTEVDHDLLLLRAAVDQCLELVEAGWGAPGRRFVEELLDGTVLPLARVKAGLSPEDQEEIVDLLRKELEGWAA